MKRKKQEKNYTHDFKTRITYTVLKKYYSIVQNPEEIGWFDGTRQSFGVRQLEEKLCPTHNND